MSEIQRQKEEWQRDASVEFSKLNAGSALAIYENRGHVRELKDNREIAEKYLEIEAVGSAAELCSTRKECAEINSEIRELKRACGKLGEDLIKIENQNKSRVFEYKGLQVEKALLLKEIHAGTANWAEYSELKN